MSVKLILGKGNDTARIALIGEAPRAEEEKQGKPFVGKSGELLADMLEKAGIAQDDVYITNAVKVRPVNNRTPTNEELGSWKKLLVAEISKVAPNVIVPLGACAAKVLLGDDIKITKIRGKQFHTSLMYFNRMDGRLICPQIMPTFHPAYILRNIKEKGTVIKDLEKARNQI